MHTESDQKFKIMVMLMELTCKKKIDLFINYMVAILKSIVSNSYYYNNGMLRGTNQYEFVPTSPHNSYLAQYNLKMVALSVKRSIQTSLPFPWASLWTFAHKSHRTLTKTGKGTVCQKGQGLS